MALSADTGNTSIYERVFGASGGQPTAAIPTMLNDSAEKEELGAEVMKKIEDSEGRFRSWEGPARDDMRNYLGHQWDDVDRMRMEQLKRPALTFNEIKPVINAVSGLERLNRTDINFKTRALDSPMQLDMAGDLATESVIASDDMCNAAEEDSDLSKEATITGMAWGEVRMDYDIDVNGRVVFEKIPCWEMRWSDCKRVNLEGSDWRARKQQVPRKKFAKLYGKENLERVDAAVPDMPYGQTQKYELVTPYYSMANEKANPQVGSQTQMKSTVEVIQYQWKDMQPIYRFMDPDSGEITTFDEDKWGRLTDRMKMVGMEPPPAVQQQKPVYRQVYVSRGVVLEDPVDLPSGFSLLCMTGEWDDDKKRFVGLVHDMLDPQKTKNKAISSALGFHITNAKGGALFKTSAFADPDHAKDQWSRFDAWIEVNDEANIQTDIVPREPAKMSPDLGMFYTEGSKAIHAVSGLNPELVGTATGQTPSQTARGRQQEGLIVLGWYWDNLNRHRKERASVTLEFIREFWTQGQLIEVGGDSMAQTVPLLKESLPEQFAYRMVLDDSIRHNPNLKAQVWRELSETGVIQALLKFGAGNVILQLLKFSPFPSSVVNMIQRTVAQSPPKPPQKGKGKSDPPEMVQAKVGLMGAQQQKALSQAREIDQRTGLKVAELTVKGSAEAHRIKAEQERTRMQQLAKQTGFEGQGFNGVQQ